jgi:hypothetical protein
MKSNDNAHCDAICHILGFINTKVTLTKTHCTSTKQSQLSIAKIHNHTRQNKTLYVQLQRLIKELIDKLTTSARVKNRNQIILQWRSGSVGGVWVVS